MAVRWKPSASSMRCRRAACAIRKWSSSAAQEPNRRGRMALGARILRMGRESMRQTKRRPYRFSVKGPGLYSFRFLLASRVASTAGRKTSAVLRRCERFWAIDHRPGRGDQESCSSLRPAHRFMASGLRPRSLLLARRSCPVGQIDKVFRHAQHGLSANLTPSRIVSDHKKCASTERWRMDSTPVLGRHVVPPGRVCVWGKRTSGPSSPIFVLMTNEWLGWLNRQPSTLSQSTALTLDFLPRCPS